jgi:hypothetical protein
MVVLFCILVLIKYSRNPKDVEGNKAQGRGGREPVVGENRREALRR